MRRRARAGRRRSARRWPPWWSRRAPAAGPVPSSGKIRLPPPSRIGSTISRYSSTRSCSTSCAASDELPITWSPRPSCSRSSRTASIASSAAQQLRAGPGQVVLAERPGGHVLGDLVHSVGERIAAALGPGCGHSLPGAPAEQQGIGRGHDLVQGRTHRLGVEVGMRPAAVGEVAIGVFVLPARCLHHAVQAHEVAEDDLHRCSFRGCARATIGAGRIRRAAEPR